MRIEPVTLAETWPKAILFARGLRMKLTGRPYFFNGQRGRSRVFHALEEKVQFQNYVETGTFLGMTTHFLASRARARHAHVHSCELNDRFFAIARDVTVNSQYDVALSPGGQIVSVGLSQTAH